MHNPILKQNDLGCKSQSSAKVTKMLSFLPKVLILGISFKLLASLSEYCYKCDGRCTKPPNAENCNVSIDKNPVCMIERDPIEKKERRSCLYPSTDSVYISKCNKTDDGLCRICKGNLCNSPIKRKMKGVSRCYYCQGICKNPLETVNCYFLENVCGITMKTLEKEDWDSEEQKYVKKTQTFIIRDCYPVEDNKSVCDYYENFPDTNCTVCNTNKCNRLPSDPPDPTPHPQFTGNYANMFECNRILFEFSIYIVTFIMK